MSDYIDYMLEHGLDDEVLIELIEKHINENYIKLPKDINGDVIRLGSVVRHGDNVETVVGLADDAIFVSFVDELLCTDGLRRFVPWSTNSKIKVELFKPDTQEKIDADALIVPCDYFDEQHADCKNCPKHKDDISCDSLLILDLLRRQRELFGDVEDKS